MSKEEQYKLALFAVIRNSTVMPKGMELGKSRKQINKMSVETVTEVLNMCDFERLKKSWEEGED